MAKKVLSDHDMIHMIYTEMVGINSHGGMVKEHHAMRKEVTDIKLAMVSKKECDGHRKSAARKGMEGAEKKLTIGQTIINVVLAIGVILTLLYGTGILVP